MSMQTLYRVVCDDPGCGAVPVNAPYLTPEAATECARFMEWQVGPFRVEHAGAVATFNEGWAFCPKHKRTEGES